MIRFTNGKRQNDPTNFIPNYRSVGSEIRLYTTLDPELRMNFDDPIVAPWDNQMAFKGGDGLSFGERIR